MLRDELIKKAKGLGIKGIYVMKKVDLEWAIDKDSDNYATDKLGWEIIQEYIPKNKVIWSPFYCDGKQKEYFEEMGYNIIHEDKDFFSYVPNYDIIIDNPPFSKMKEICFRPFTNNYSIYKTYFYSFN